MVVMTLTRPDVIVLDGPYTIEERDALPDDGRRHELLDGLLVMCAAPGRRHQDFAARLWQLLNSVAPASVKVMMGPFDVRFPPKTVIEADVLVARRPDVTDTDLPTAPLLSVEVLSPSTRSFDLNDKKAILEREGCPSYWVIDPQRLELTAFELRDGQYVEVASVRGPDPWHARLPFEVTVVVENLLDE